MTKIDAISSTSSFRSNRSIALPNLLGAVGTAGFWLAIVFGCISLEGITTRSILISADAAVLLIPILLRFVSGTFDLFEPILMAILALMSMMIGRPMSDISIGNYREHHYDISATYNAALLLVLCANLSFILGYELPLGRMIASRFSKVSTHFNTRIATTWAFLISIIGALVFGSFLLNNGGLRALLTLSHGANENNTNAFAGTSAYIYNAVGLLVPAGAIMFALWLRSRKLKFLVVSAIILAPYLVYMIAGGARSGAVGVLFGLPFMWYFYHQKRPSGLTLIICMLTMGFIFSVQRDSRAELGGAKGQALQKALSDPLSTMLNLFKSDDDEMFDVVAEEIAVIPNWIPYAHGSVVSDIFLRAIPKTMFPNNAKPKDAYLVFFSTMEPQRARYSGAGTATSIIGNFYLDSGAVTSIAYMFLMGIILRTSWAYFLANKRSLILLIAYSAVPGYVLTTARGDLASLIAALPYGVIPVVILFFMQRLQLRNSPRTRFAIST